MNEEKLNKLVRELRERTQRGIDGGLASMSDYNLLRDCEIALGETCASETTVSRARVRLASRMGVEP